MSDAPEPYDLDFETPAPVARPVPAPPPGLPRPVPARAPGFPQPAPAPAAAPVVMAQRVTTFSDRKPTCAACNQAIADAYYSAGRKIICPQCHAQITGTGAGAATLRVFKAIGLGTVAGIIGAAIWLGVRRATHYEIGYVALLVGFLVGAAVRMGSGNRGGVGYQILAVVLTYLAVAANYTPDAYRGLMKGYESANSSAATAQPTGAAQPESGEPSTALKVVFVVIAFVFSLILPIKMLPANIIGVVIIAIALWEAWKINMGGISSIAGPFSLRAARAPA